MSERSLDLRSALLSALDADLLLAEKATRVWPVQIGADVPVLNFFARFRTLGPLALKAIREQVQGHEVNSYEQGAGCSACRRVGWPCNVLRSICATLYPELLEEK